MIGSLPPVRQQRVRRDARAGKDQYRGATRDASRLSARADQTGRTWVQTRANETGKIHQSVAPWCARNA